MPLEIVRSAFRLRRLARENSCFGGPKSTFRDRRKGAVLLRNADFVAGTVLLDMVVIFNAL